MFDRRDFETNYGHQSVILLRQHQTLERFGKTRFILILVWISSAYRMLHTVLDLFFCQILR